MQLGRGAGYGGRPICRGDPRAWAGQRGVLRLGPVADGGLLRLQQAGHGLVGTNNIDSNSRLCMSSAVAGYKTTLGSDAPPACYEDIEHAQCIFIAGANTALCASRSCSAASKLREKSQSGPETDRGRSAPHRHRSQRRPASGHPARHRCGAVQRHAARAAVGRTGGFRVHSRPHRRLRCPQGHGAGIHAQNGGADLRRDRSASHPGGAMVRPVRRDAVAVLPGAESIHPRHATTTPR